MRLAEGFDFEAASAALACAFDSHHWPRVISLIDPANNRSIRLAERLEEQFEREVVVRSHRVSLYALGREDWHGAGRSCRAATAGPPAAFPWS